MTPWLFFIALVKWVAAVFCGVTLAIALVVVCIAFVAELRDVL